MLEIMKYDLKLSQGLSIVKRRAQRLNRSVKFSVALGQTLEPETPKTEEKL